MDFFTQEQIFIICIISLSAVAFVKYRNFGYIKNIFSASINYNSAQLIQKSDISNKTLTNFLLSLNFFLAATVFLISILGKFNFLPLDINRFVIFAGIIIGIILLIYLNSVINYFSAYIFNLKDIAKDYDKNNQFLFHSMGIILLFINILISFTSIKETALYTGIIICVISYLLRILRFIKINLSKHINSFFMFLYLCTVEILPLLYFYKILTL
ncbi:MAG: DUF4271 domain-containing protein [Chlorobi bacterium]|nr:DUF4271 domain-containing protein [Chlorobiota bacterium]